MLFSARKLIGLKVLARAGTYLGIVQGLIVGASTGKVLALRLSDHRLILLVHLVVFAPPQIVARAATSFKFPPDGLEILKHRVVTLEGKAVGRLEDFHFDPPSGLIMIYRVRVNQIQRLLAKDLMIPRHNVIAIEEKRIIVKDLVLKRRNPLRRLLDKEEDLPSPSQATAT